MYKKFADLLLKNNKTTYRVAKDTGISPTLFQTGKRGKANLRLINFKSWQIISEFHLIIFLKNKNICSCGS